MRAADVMTLDFLTVDRETSIYEAAGLMIEKQAPFALVLEDPGRPAGIFTGSDLLKMFAPGSIRFLDAVVCLNRGYHDLNNFFKQTKIHEVMTWPVHGVNVDMPVDRVITVILENDVDQLTVLEKGLVAGVIRRSDLVRVLYRASLAGGQSGCLDGAVNN